jgi:hypothetical protein
VAGALSNPQLQLVRISDITTIATNDNWGSAANAAVLQSSGFAPSTALESAIYVTLDPARTPAIVSGVGGVTGVGLIEVYEVDQPDTPLINISTRGRVSTGFDVMIGGFVIQGTGPETVVIRAIGPSLANFGITGALANPTMQLVRISDSATLATNDDWGSAANAAQIISSGVRAEQPARIGDPHHAAARRLHGDRLGRGRHQRHGTRRGLQSRAVALSLQMSHPPVGGCGLRPLFSESHPSTPCRIPMNRTIATTFLAAIVGLCAFAAQAASVLPMYLDELADHAAIVFQAKCTANRAELDQERNTVVTYTTFEVRDVLKGDVAAVHEIKQIGGVLPGENLERRVLGVPTFAEGEEYVVFLAGVSSAGFSSPLGTRAGPVRGAARRRFEAGGQRPRFSRHRGPHGRALAAARAGADRRVAGARRRHGPRGFQAGHP